MYGNVLHKLNGATKGRLVQEGDHVLSMGIESNVSIVMHVQELAKF